MASDQYLAVPNLTLHKYVHLKVSVFALRLFRNRLPTKDNLFRRGIIPPGSRSCVGGCGDLETVNHLFLECHFFGSLWHLARKRIGFSSVNPFVISDQIT